MFLQEKCFSINPFHHLFEQINQRIFTRHLIFLLLSNRSVIAVAITIAIAVAISVVSEIQGLFHLCCGLKNGWMNAFRLHSWSFLFWSSFLYPIVLTSTNIKMILCWQWGKWKLLFDLWSHIGVNYVISSCFCDNSYAINLST